MVGAKKRRNMPVLSWSGLVDQGAATGLATLLRVSDSHGPVPGGTRAMPPWGFARVRGDSMRPTLRPGDRLLVRYARRAPGGDVVGARLPGGVLATKRAPARRTTQLGEPGWWL